MPWNSGGTGGSGEGGGGGDDDDGVRHGPWGAPPPGGQRPNTGRPNGPRPQGPQGPWGGGGPGGGFRGGPPPDLDDILQRAQGFIRGLLPPRFGGGGGGGGGRFSGGRGALIVIALAVLVWLASGFYNVQPDQQGVVLRFGAYTGFTQAGLNYHLPWPIERVLTPAVTRVNRVEVGYRSAAGDQYAQQPGQIEAPSRDIPEESLMLTGDENIIDMHFAVFWRISNAADFLFNTRHPENTVKAAAESVMREVVGKTPIQPALTDARAQIESEVLKGVQAILDQYKSGVEVSQVQLQKVDPPAAVIDSFRDVQRATTDADRMRNEAESYRNDIVPRARGDAARLVAEADGARQASVAEASGQAQRFLSVLKAYAASKDVTMARLYIETMQEILSHSSTTIVDDKLQGIVPFLSLGDQGRPTLPPLAPAAPPTPQPGVRGVPTR